MYYETKIAEAIAELRGLVALSKRNCGAELRTINSAEAFLKSGCRCLYSNQDCDVLQSLNSHITSIQKGW